MNVFYDDDQVVIIIKLNTPIKTIIYDGTIYYFYYIFYITCDVSLKPLDIGCQQPSSAIDF